jgi:GxxExxY protein
MTGQEELERLNPMTERIIGCAIEVHKVPGGGLLEPTYETAMCIELEGAGLSYARQPTFPITYKGKQIGHHRVDLVVEQSVVVELKSVERWDPVFESQILTYLRCTSSHVGLLINFHGRLPKTGIHRYAL